MLFYSLTRTVYALRTVKQSRRCSDFVRLDTSSFPAFSFVRLFPVCSRTATRVPVVYGCRTCKWMEILGKRKQLSDGRVRSAIAMISKLVGV